MIRVNEHYSKLSASYLFSRIAERVRHFSDEHPDVDVIKLGIGDVTRPLPPSVVAALHAAADEMADVAGFRGYGPEQGYDFLRQAIVSGDYAPLGVSIDADDVFVSDGSKCDSGNFQELFAPEIRIAVPDPVYPVYVDTNVMAGRTGAFHDGHYDGLVYLVGSVDNGFVPAPPAQPVDLIYLCFPNNPTGAVATRDQLQAFVDYARESNAIILFDAAYAEFIRDSDLPRSIYQIPGANECAVEFRSFSKTAGFTGLRCAYTVVPKTVRAFTDSGRPVVLRDLWFRRQATKFNGASYPIQRAAAAIYTPAGRAEVRGLTDFYLQNAALISERMGAAGYTCHGGSNAPYVWIGSGGSSWETFDRLLHESGVVCTPGSGFGPAGEGYVRLSAFAERDAVETAMERIAAR